MVFPFCISSSVCVCTEPTRGWALPRLLVRDPPAGPMGTKPPFCPILPWHEWPCCAYVVFSHPGLPTHGV